MKRTYILPNVKTILLRSRAAMLSGSLRISGSDAHTDGGSYDKALSREMDFFDDEE